ncbi:MAG: NAD-dependent epimerase/dehydratase family protein, partial [Planctomycetes bacterium]|nr:NAD-dependent epimerase/dehydratase family protein [Planctomycetota bacterium]
PGVEPIVCDVLNPASLRSLPQVDTVLYAIGFDRSSGASMRDVYVNGLANVLAHLPTPKRFLYISSSSVYGQTDGSWVDENSPTHPAEPSGKIVLEAERVLRSEPEALAKEAHPSLTLQALTPAPIILRFAGIYGPGRLLRRQTIEKGDPIVGDADKWLNLIHVDDGARAVLAAEERGQPGNIYNVCDDHPVRRRYFYAAMARVLAAPEPSFVSPPPAQTPPHELAHRRINNRRMKVELGVELRYPDYDQGLRASV